MQNTFRDFDQLSRETGLSETELIARALRVGLRQLQREQVLDRYLRGEIDRAETIQQAGSMWVELAERQREAVKEDVTWALEG